MAEQTGTKSLHLVELRASNFMGLKAVTVALQEKGVVEVTGPNGAGKTSFMRAIECLVGGAKVHPTEAIRRGAEQAELLGKLKGTAGELIVERRFRKTEKGETSTVVVRAADGSRYDKPQTILDALFNATLDPEAFRQLPREKRLEQLRELAGLNLGALEGKRQDLYEQRTEVNRKGGDLKARFTALPMPPKDLPEKPVDVKALLAEQEEKRKAQQQQQAARHALSNLRVDVEGLERATTAAADHVAILERDLNGARLALKARAEELVVSTEAFNAQQEIVAQLVEPDFSKLGEQISAAQATNIAIARESDRKKMEAEVEALRKQRDELTAAIEALDKEKLEAIAAAKFPVEGLGITADGTDVAFNGFPFEQVNMAQQLRVSTAICLARNPTMRVLGIRRGSDLDSRGMAVIAEEAAKHDAQIFVERVADKGEVGIVFEDGEVVSPKPPAKPEQPDLGLKVVRGGAA